MVRMILGVVAGFIVWSLIWIGVHTVLTMISPDWYGANHREFEQAAQSGLPYMSKTPMVLLAFALSIVCSLIAGFVAVLIARENTKSTLILGILLLLVGLFVEISYWHYFPIWYHFLFLFFLIPSTIWGGRLMRQRRAI